MISIVCRVGIEGQDEAKNRKEKKKQKSRREERRKKLPKNADAASKTGLDGKKDILMGGREKRIFHPPSFGAPGKLATTTNLAREKKPKRRKDSRKEEKQKTDKQRRRKER